jgi:hypothetical protein
LTIPPFLGRQRPAAPAGLQAASVSGWLPLLAGGLAQRIRRFDLDGHSQQMAIQLFVHSPSNPSQNLNFASTLKAFKS